MSSKLNWLWFCIAIALYVSGPARATTVADCPVFSRPERTAQFDRWTVEWRKQPGDVALHISASPNGARRNGFTCLVIQCVGGVAGVYIETGGRIAATTNRRVTLTYRVDGGPRSKRVFSSSSDGLALGLWRAPDAVSFVAALRGGATLQISRTSHTSSPTDFKIEGLDKAIDAAGDSCFR